MAKQMGNTKTKDVAQHAELPLDDHLDDHDEPVNGEVLNGPDTALVAQDRQRPIALTDGMALLPVAQQEAVLAEYDARRKHFRKWLKEHLTQGVHFGYPPGCEPRGNVDARQWQSKPSLYKAGALLLVDLLKLQVAYDADQEAWRQLGGKAGQFVMKCVLINPATKLPIGEGRGVFEVGEKKMGSNAAIKMAEKRALVDAVINSIAVCADLFTQDMDEPPPESAKPEKDPFAPNAPTRQQRAATPITQSDIKPLWDGWHALAMEQWPGDKNLAGRFKQYVNSIAGATIGSLEDWTAELVAAVKRDLDTNKTAIPVDQRE